jgi:hypothetical protein
MTLAAVGDEGLTVPPTSGIVADGERMPPPHRGNLGIALPGSSATKEIERLSSTGDEALDGTLGALSAAEVRRVPLSVWQLLCEAAGRPSGQVSQEALLDIARGHAEILVTAGRVPARRWPRPKCPTG